MGDVIAFKRKTIKEKHKGKTLCKNGHHKWVTIKDNQFDVKEGKLVTVLECSRCKQRRHKLTN